jgi:hypothetical protein
MAELRALLAQATRPRVRAALNASLSDWLSMPHCGAWALEGSDGDQLPHIEELEVCFMYGCMDGRTDGWMDVCMYGFMDLWIYGFMYFSVYVYTCGFMYLCISVLMYIHASS